MKKHEEDFPITRHDPGTIPDPPDHFGEAAAEWFWRLCSWMKVRTALHTDVETIEDISELLAMHEDEEMKEVDRDTALMNANLKLREIGFSTVDFNHLEIPTHEEFM